MFDVIVIGAGLAGLQAAYSCQKQGLSILVLEGRSRVGGKTWTVPLSSGRGNADLGAAWINDTKQKRVWAYAKQFGLRVVKQRIEGTAIMEVSDNERQVYPFGIIPDFPDHVKKELEFVRDSIQTASLTASPPTPSDDSISLDQYARNLGAGATALKMVNLWTQVMHGLESTEESAAFFIDYCRRNHGFFAVRADDSTGGNYLRLPQGTQSFAKGIAELVGHHNIHLSSPVIAIHQLDSRVEVTTTTGNRYLGRKAILAIPSAMFRDIKISPALPASVQEITSSSKLGDYTKVIVCYNKPWWRDQGYNGFFMSYIGPVSSARDTSVDDDRNYALTCFVNGQFGREWSTLDPHARRAAVIRQLARVYNAGPDSEVYRPIEVFEQIWMNEPFSKGALTSVPAIGHYTKFASIYGKPVKNLHFVGTEYSKEWKGYMEGALCSGEHGAAEVAAALGCERSSKL